MLAEPAGGTPTTYRATLNVVMRTAGDPGILRMSSHLLQVGRKSR